MDVKSHVASAISYVASGATASYGMWSFDHILAVGGFMLGAMTFMVNWYFRFKMHQLAVRAFDAEQARQEAAQQRQGGSYERLDRHS